jgi:hypothetical protein
LRGARNKDVSGGQKSCKAGKADCQSAAACQAAPQLFRGRFDFFGVVLEDVPQKPNAAIEDFFGRPPIGFGCPQMNGKLPSELQRVSVQRLILLFEAHVFKALGSVLVPY